MTEKPEALRIADELTATVGTQSTYSAMHEAAVELRRLVAQRDALMGVLRQMIDLADFWINHRQQRHMSEQELRAWLSLGHESNAMRKARAALAEPVQTQQENAMPITDDNGEAMRPQYRVIEQRGNWYLLYDQRQVGDSVRHEFRIQKLRHDIALYHGITLAEAQKRFHEKVEADHE